MADRSLILGLINKMVLYIYLVNIPKNGWILICNEQQYKTILGNSLEGVFDMSSTKTYDAQGREIK